jgi:hypothetical protein
MGTLALGIELSTQSVKLAALDAGTGELVFHDGFDYEAELPGYGTSGGVLPAPDSLTRHTSPLMLVAALDAAFSRLAASGLELGQVGAIKADAISTASRRATTTRTSTSASWQQTEALLYALKRIGYREHLGLDIYPERMPIQKAAELSSRALHTINERIERLPHERLIDCYLDPASHRGVEAILLDSMLPR